MSYSNKIIKFIDVYLLIVNIFLFILATNIYYDIDLELFKPILSGLNPKMAITFYSIINFSLNVIWVIIKLLYHSNILKKQIKKNYYLELINILIAFLLFYLAGIVLNSFADVKLFHFIKK